MQTEKRRNLVLKRAARQLTFRRAALVAISSLEQSMLGTTDVKRFVRLNTRLLQLQTASLMAESDFLEALAEIGHNDKELIVMKLMDRDGNGKINLREMAIAFSKMDATKAYAKSVEDAHTAIQKSDEDGDGMLNRKEFSAFLKDLGDALECTFDDLCFCLMEWLSFNDTGHDIIQETMQDNAIFHSHDDDEEEQDNQKHDVEEEVTETRIALLFQCLDSHGRGRVLFLDVFERLFETIKSMDVETRNVLFMMDRKEDATRELNYREFTNLLINVSASCQPNDTHFHDIADAMTYACAVADQNLSKDMVSVLADVQIDKAFEPGKVAQHLQEEKGISRLTYGRIQNLFRMIDTDGSGFIEADEMVISFRKLQGTSKDIDETIEDAVTMIAEVDRDKDQRLNLDEYAVLLCSLASSLDTDVNELVSYMAVELALRDDNEADLDYARKMKKRVARKVKAKELQSESSWKWLNGITGVKS